MIYLVMIEPIDTRYTQEWYEHLPTLFTNNGLEWAIIEGSDRTGGYSTSPNAFLDFSATNIYKSEQVIRMAELFSNKLVKPNDQFIFFDAWHPGIINLKYMSDLNQVPVVTHGLWHAGSYDPMDFLGYSIKDKTWSNLVERAYFEIIDYNYFATQFHINLFLENCLGHYSSKPVGSGFPFWYLREIFQTIQESKENLVLFPHRKSKEKQLDIFLDLEKQLPQYNFYVCSGNVKSKDEYRQMHKRSKLTFSANLQETLGIGCYEQLCAGGAVMVPDRLSYSEMYIGEFVYPSEWTINYNAYLENRTSVCDRVVYLMEQFHSTHIQDLITKNLNNIHDNYFSANTMIGIIKDVQSRS
ncbi:MAG: hypothetical protein HC836_22800 [Richelia sp. RM2_1_2]|nr:hypothetical protein [Richelia sp. RM2_1_2]